MADVRQGDVRVMENRPYSMKASFEALSPLVKDCRGIMVFENTFVGAFMDVPLYKIYDVMEIPPFGRLGDPVYQGLSAERIDCVLVSHSLATEIGIATNSQIRYENYIKPYIEQLQARGAVTYKIDRFGEAIILPKLKKGIGG
jgi:hypothetical protein